MGRVFYVIILSIDRQTCSRACLKNKGDTHGFQLDALSMDLSALVLAAYYISPGKIRNGILVFFSLLFMHGESTLCFLMLFSVAVNFTGGILIEKYQTRKKKILVATLIINLGLLGYFKYFGTLTEAITGLFSADGTGTTLFQVALPIGISFYTFQALSYVIDVYRGECRHSTISGICFCIFPFSHS